ncbi:MAG: DNA polymerase IV [Myxococcales bacterium]|nr:DNA polymerase IV [Myxococcales bacterium]
MGNPAPRTCCLDLDTFFVSVERLLDPSLVGKPVVVGGRKGERGVVTAASYEVRALGVRSGMPMYEAVRRAPHAIFLPTRHGIYGPYARSVRALLDDFTPRVQTASIDEFFLDFGGCERLYHDPGDADADATIERVAHQMRLRIEREIGLPASAGIGTTRAIAKIASGRAKPAGVCLVRAGQELAFVAPLAARKYPGIGPVAEARLLAGGVRTLGELLRVAPEGSHHPFVGLADMVRHGIDGARAAALGRDRPAFQEHDPEGATAGSISNERTFARDVRDRRGVEAQLLALVERVCWRARRRGVRARTVTLKLRYADFATLLRSRTIPATCRDADVQRAVQELLARAWTRPLGLRLLGVALSNLVAAETQLALPFAAHERPDEGRAIDAVRERFGYDAIRRGRVGAGTSWLA